MTVPSSDQFTTLAETTTTADPGTGGVSLAVSSRTAFPQAAQFWIVVQDSATSTGNREIMLVTAGAGSGAGSFTVTRAQESTTAVAHPVGSYVACVQTATSLNKHVSSLVNQPRHFSLLSWTQDPDTLTTSNLLTSGQLSLTKIWIPYTMTVTNIPHLIAVAGVTLTSNQNFIGLYDSAGNRLGTSADQAANWVGTGLITAALTVPVAVTGGPDVFCWVAFLANGTTPPKPAQQNNLGTAYVNLGLSAATSRCGTILSGQTSLPATITPGSISANSNLFWASLS